MKFFRIVGFVLTVVAFAVLSGEAGLAQTAIRFSLDGKFEGPAAPFLVAIDKGYFQAEGLDVTIDTADDPLQPINRVATGGYDMGVADLTTLMKFRDAKPGTPVTALFIVTNKPAFAIISRRSRGIENPKDLEGKTLGTPPADQTFALWRVFTQANSIDPGKVKIESIGTPVREPMLQNGQVDAITGLSYSSFVNLMSMGVPTDDLVLMLLADHGVNAYGDVIIVNSKFATEKPEAVKGFLRALVKGLRDTVKHPATVIESVIKRNDTTRRSIELERLRIAIRDNFVTPEVKANGYGAVDPDRLAKSIDQLAAGIEFKTKPKAADTFDPSFLPSAAERKAD